MYRYTSKFIFLMSFQIHLPVQSINCMKKKALEDCKLTRTKWYKVQKLHNIHFTSTLSSVDCIHYHIHLIDTFKGKVVYIVAKQFEILDCRHCSTKTSLSRLDSITNLVLRTLYAVPTQYLPSTYPVPSTSIHLYYNCLY